jgi:hypothetical protein
MMIANAMSLHAQKRLQQRAIPPFVVTLLEQCGSVIRCCGADRLIFDKAALKRLKRHLGGERNLRVIERWLDVYAVLGDDGQIITVAHQSGRHWR